MERVAEPAPALASTTSVPASWMRLVSAGMVASSKVTLGVTYGARGSGQRCRRLRSAVQEAPVSSAGGSGQRRSSNAKGAASCVWALFTPP